MLFTITVIQIVLRFLGLIVIPVMGSFIHVLLIIAVILVSVRIISGRRAL